MSTIVLRGYSLSVFPEKMVYFDKDLIFMSLYVIWFLI
ncbi:hypothetical protein CZ809_00634 [Photobacterium piscicola]|uniref:Uncharacterized protein n=1 Tax=Photobacterium piscicola TaxID=1378299 RepID=A0A1T5HWT3_9GAMM|nr:hypothetical protein CZ809_00634 [Photobacterium piscicola]